MYGLRRESLIEGGDFVALVEALLSESAFIL